MSHSRGSMPAESQSKALQSPSSRFLLWKWVSARVGGEPSVPGRGGPSRRGSAASESAVLVQVGPVCAGEVGALVWLAV